MGKDLFNDRISRFSIRKLNVGVCSVLLGTLVMVGTASQVSADETANQVQAGDVTSTTATVSDESSSQTAVAAQASTEVANILSSTETNSQSQTVSNASSAYSETSTTQASSETTSQAATSTSATTAASTTSVAGSTSVGNTTGVSTTASVTSASSETPASETASEAQGVDVQAEASTTNALSSGAEASAVEQPVVTAETSGRRRTRRALGDPNDESLIGDDVEDATSTPKVEKPGFTTNVDAKSMASQISWLDFGDVANWTGTTTVLVPKSEVKPTENLEEKLALQVGSTYTKEIMPGYVVTVKVKSLKPFQATEIYKKRMENQGATEAEKATYDPNAKNGYVSGVTSNAARQAFNNGEEAKIVADAQNNWTEIRFENIDTKTKKTTISSALNGGNIGVQFEISATFRGKTVKPAIVMADGESANPGELVMFTTNGEGWQHIGEWKKFTRPTTSVTYSPQDTENLFGPNPKFNNTNLNQLRRSTEVGPEKKPVAWKYFGNPDKVTGGLGTGIFGPNISEGDPNVPIDEDTPATFEDGSTTKTVDGEGTYTVSPDGTVTFVPEKSFTGTATGVTVKRVDKNGTEITAKYTPTVTPVTPTAAPAETTDIQGATQTGKPEFTAGDSRVPMNDDVPATFDDGSTTKTVDGVGTYTVAADGTVTFVPEKSFTGKAPAVTVVREDKNGTKASATYTPTVTPVTPTAEDTTSTDKQGQTQTGTPTFTPGNPNVPMDDDTPATFEDGSTTKNIPGEGTYTVAPDGTVTFVPEKSFTGTGTGVTVKRVDKNGTPVTAKYTPTVTPVTPTATPAESEAPQGVVQTGTVTFTEGDPVAPIDKDTITLLDENGQPAASVDAKSPTGDVIGTFTVDKETGVVTFTPTDKSYSGEVVPVKVQAKDTNGTVAETTYTPKITPVVPTADPATSTDIQGKTQTGTPSFKPGNPAIPMDDDVPATFEDGTTTKTIPGEGTYTVAPDGTVTFVPEKSFTGTGTGVTVKRVDKNGTPVTATYTPTVTPVTPTAEPTTSTGKQGQTQTGKPEFTEGDSRVPMNDDVPATFEDGTTTKTVDGVGTYTVAADGTVTFVPEKSFVGTAPAVTVVREDVNGTKASATYTPTVTSVTPTATPAESTGPQGVVQTGTVTFTEGDSVAPIDKDTITLLDENGQPAAAVFAKSPAGNIIGTFTVDKDTGVVTFTPTDKSYSGDVVPVKVQAADTNGTTVETTYTPKITPVAPTSEDATSTDIQGATQTGKPSFTEGNPNVPIDEDTPATFEDGSTTKTVDGEGTYTVSPDGTVTFVPEKSFTGTASGVTVKRVDKNGTEITAKYTPTVTPVTPTATPAESTDIQGATQTGKPEFTEGDSRVPMNDDVPATFDDGTTTKAVEGVGTYTVAADGTVTFVPEKSFVGEAPAVTVVREDKNGTKASATYTPTVTPVTPTAAPATSTDIQGQTQTGKPSFMSGNPSVPMDDDVPATFDDGSTTKVIPGEGTYTVSPDGTVTFVPEKAFTGTGTGVTVKRVDKNGTAITATYTPTVTPVTPTAESVTSIGNKGQTQTGKPSFTEGDSRVPMNNQVPATFEDGSTTKTISGVGTYTVAADGTVTFTPEPEFTGTAPAVTVVREDVNGTKASATYTPTVLPITKFVDKEGKEIPGYPTVDGEQPKVEIPGYRFVETKKLPNGDIEHVYEQVTTSYVDENGTPIPGYPTEDGQQPKKDIPGYEFVKTVVDENGNTQHIYKQIVTPTPVPDTTPTPEPQPAPQTEEPKAPVLPETKEEAHFINPTDKTAQLPETGSEDSNLAIFGLASLLAGFGLYGTKRRKR